MLEGLKHFIFFGRKCRNGGGLCGKKLGIPVKVVVPETTTPRSIGSPEEDNAEVIIHGTSLEANILAQSIMTDETAFIHPFDGELLWLGHSSTLMKSIPQNLNRI